MADSLRESQIDAHYDRARLGESILDALAAAGKHPDRLTPLDLAPVDEFHLRGLVATRELAALSGIAPGSRVLDLGGGLGGPARILAWEFGAEVEVLDLTEEFCRSGNLITRRLGLEDRVSFRHGNALDLPHPDASWDVVWMQHSGMNIEDKETLYRGVSRVLPIGGRLALHEILAGPVDSLHFPVPWAREPEISFLATPETTRRILGEQGFEPLVWRDTTPESASWIRERLDSMDKGAPPLGIHLVLGDDFAPLFRNLLRNLEEDRARVILSVWERR